MARGSALRVKTVLSGAAQAALAPKSTSNVQVTIGETPKFKFTAKQLEGLKLMRGPQRNTMFVGGARSAKTFLVVKQIVNRAIKAPFSRHAILRFRGNAVWATIGKDTLPKVMRLCFPGVALSGPHKEGYFTLPNGAEIWLAGLDEKERVEKILGMEFSSMFFNECSQIPYDSVLLALTRLAQVVEGLIQRAYFDLNPPNRSHWTYVLFILKKDPISKQPIPDPENYEFMFISPRDNAENLTPEFIRSLENLPARKRKRFFEGQYGDDTEGALWTLETLEQMRVKPEQVPDLRSIVVAVDPSGAKNENDTDHDAIGIVVFGLGVDGHGYILEDLTCLDGPNGWGKRTVAAFHARQADHVTGEINFGGAMVEYVIKSIDPTVPFREVTASRGKVVRAEPVSALSEQKLIHIVGKPMANGQYTYFPELEDELLGFTTLGYIGEGSPNRADALVWAATDLMLVGNANAWIGHYAKLAEQANAAPEVSPDLAPGKQRPTLNLGNELTEIYQRTLRGTMEHEQLCAHPRCGKPITDGNRVTDGISSWHPGCYQ